MADIGCHPYSSPDFRGGYQGSIKEPESRAFNREARNNLCPPLSLRRGSFRLLPGYTYLRFT